MKSIIIILIGFILLSSSPTFGGSDCENGPMVILTNPLQGARTFHDSIMVRGYLCESHPVIQIKNQTTSKTSFAATDKVCGKAGCTYRFAVPVRGLAMGANHITATVLGQMPPMEVSTEIMRTALAGLDF